VRLPRFLFALLAAGLACAQQTPTIISVVDPYTGGTKLSPGGLAVIAGTLPNGNPNVTVGGKLANNLAPPYLTNGRQMTIQIPADAPLGTVNVVITLSTGVTSNAFPITLTAYAPVLISSASGSVMSPRHQQAGVLVTDSIPAAPGELIVFNAIGLGSTDAPAASIALGGKPVSGATVTSNTGQTGIFQVTFAVPLDTATGSIPVVLSIGGADSNTVMLSVGPPPVGPAIASILDPVLNSTALCPGGLAVLSGVNLGANPQVTVGGYPAFTVQPPLNGSTMTIEIPTEISFGMPKVQMPVVVTTAAGPSAPFSLALAQYAPVLINTPTHQNTGAPVTFANPALPGEVIQYPAIGLGPTNPVVPTGTPAPPNVPTAIAPGLYFNSGQPNGAVTAVLTPGQVGQFTVSITVPPSPPGGNPTLFLSVGPPAQGASSNILTLPTALTASPPSIDHLANNYSYLANILPNYGIAQGSIFAIFGARLANGSTGLQSIPLKTTLLGTSVDITVNGTTTHALLYYVTPGQVGAILPSGTPVGDGTITVNNGTMNASAPIHVVQSAFGILTLNGAGNGPAAAFDLSGQYLGFTNALNPGDYFVLWGTGVGPVSGDESTTQTPADLTNVPFSIEVGGVQAQVYYRGRSTYPGLDQVIGVVPAGVQPGCWVSVVTRSGNMVSNFATLPVALSGRVCSDTALGITADQMQSLMSKSSFRLGALQLDKLENTQYAIPGGLIDSDAASAQFLNLRAADFASAPLGPSLGSCIVGSSADRTWGSFAATALDAGSAVRVSGAGKSASIQFRPDPSNFYRSVSTLLWASGLIANQALAGAYIGTVGGPAGTAPLFLSDSGGGSYTFDNGSGGGDVGAFQVSVTMPSPLFSSTQLKTPTPNPIAVSRSGGFTVTWSNVSAGSYMQVSGKSSVYPAAAGAQGAFVEFTCSVSGSAGQFTVPQSVLLALPAYSSLVDPAYAALLQLSEMSLGQPFTAPGLDFGFIQTMAQFTVPAGYQ